MIKKVVILWENGLGGSGGSERIFFLFFLRIPSTRAAKKKIRSNLPDPPNPFSHSISLSKAKTADSS
jgi:hypothetical protein